MVVRCPLCLRFPKIKYNYFVSIKTDSSFNNRQEKMGS